jgi:methylmalonyl-CoA epimerase
MIKGIYGINVAVKDLHEAVARYEAVFGVHSSPLSESDFAVPGLTGAQLDINGFRINLISSSRSDTSIAKFLERKGEGVFLVSVEVDAIDEDVVAMREKGMEFVLADAVTGAFGAVNFGHPRSMHGVQIEIIQPAK